MRAANLARPAHDARSVACNSVARLAAASGYAAPMLTKLTAHGDGLAVIVPPALLAHLGLDEDAALELRIEGDALIVTGAPADRAARLRAAAARAMDAHDHTFRELAK